MTAREEISKKLFSIIYETMGAEVVKPEFSFIDDLGADSLDIVELVMTVEEDFEIDIPDDEAEKLKTVNDVIDFIEAHQAKE